MQRSIQANESKIRSDMINIFYITLFYLCLACAVFEINQYIHCIMMKRENVAFRGNLPGLNNKQI